MRTFCLIFITLGLLFSCTTPIEETQQTAAKTDAETTISLDKRLQGSWQSTEDSLYVIHFKNDQYFSAYGESLDPSSQFAIVDSCEGAAAKGEYLQVNLTDGTPMCYSVSQLTDNNLELIYLARGNTLRFKKKD